MKERIFISYKRVDKDRVFKLKESIEYETHEKCWIDLDGIESSEQFVNVIIRAINSAEIVLFMYSIAHTKITDFENDWTIRELNFAQEKKKRIFFINLDNAPLNDWFTLMFPRKQQVDASSKIAVNKLIQDIKSCFNSDNDAVRNDAILVTHTVNHKELGDDDYETGQALLDAMDYNEAVFYYVESARKGNLFAQHKLCQLFYDNRHLSEDISDDIWKTIEQMADRGESYACFVLHCKYYLDPNNKNLAFEYVKRAAQNKEFPLAILRLGTHYGWGVGTKQNHILAKFNYHKAFELGCKESCSYIGAEYEWGTAKSEKNLDKAIEYYKRGTELFDKRSMVRLAKLYFYTFYKVDEAKQVAQAMINHDYTQGFVLMGDFCAINPSESRYNGKDGIEEAKRWYRDALLHDEYSAFGSLAEIYRFFDDNPKEAYSLAYQGYYKHDSLSISTLAYFFYLDGELDKAWLYYKEVFDRYGSSSDRLGDLFFEKHYRKESHEEEERLESDLNSILSSGAHNGDFDSLKYLIRLHALQETGEDKYDYELFRKTPKIQEDIKLGAELNFPEMLYYYGRLLLDDKYREFNPVKGVNYLLSATDGYKDAVPFLLEYNKTGAYKDNVDFKKIASIAIKQKFIEGDYVQELLRYGENENSLSEAFTEYLFSILSIDNIKIKQYVFALNILLNKFKKGEVTLDDRNISQYETVISNELSKGNYGYISAIKYNLPLLFKDYDEVKIFEGYAIADSMARKLFYAAHFATDEEIDIDLQDDFLEKLHSLIQFDDSLLLDTRFLDNDVKELVQGMANFRSSYLAFCEKNSITAGEYFPPKKEFQFPYMPSSVCARISYDTFNLFMTLFDVAPEIYTQMLPILGDDSKILDYVETLTDQDLQLMLISLVEVRIDVENILLNNLGLYNNYKDNNIPPIVEYLNKLIDRLGDKATSLVATYTVENFPDISTINPTRSINDIYDREDTQRVPITKNELMKENDEDEFERLLESFINAETKR